MLATLDTRDFQTQLRQAESSQAQAAAQYKDAVANFRRYENLYKQSVVSKAQYDTFKTQVDVTLSVLNAAKAQTAAVRDSLKDTSLKAPFDALPDRVFPLKIKEFVIQADPNTNFSNYSCNVSGKRCNASSRNVSDS